MIKRLFIGGHQDGKWHDVQESWRFIDMQIPVTRDFVGASFLQGNSEHYVLRSITGEATEAYVFVLETMSAEAVRDSLLKHYHPEQSQRDVETDPI